jgi:hypothetical protein
MLIVHRPDGTWHQFLGDQLGTLLAARALEKYKQSQKPMSELYSVVFAFQQG